MYRFFTETEETNAELAKEVAEAILPLSALCLSEEFDVTLLVRVLNDLDFLTLLAL